MSMKQMQQKSKMVNWACLFRKGGMLVKDKIELLVRKMVMDYLNKDKKTPRNRQLLVILDDQPVMKTNDLWNEIKTIASNYQTTILASEKWTNVPDDMKFVTTVPLEEEHLDKIQEEMQKADVLLYATASYSTLGKLSLTLDDNMSMWVTIQMQLNGKQIVLANDHFIQKGTQKITTPFTVAKRIQSYIRTLREDKVQVVTLETACKWLDSYFDSFTENRHVVLAKHIEEAAKLGESQLMIPKNSLITPMCKDYARELGVKILQKE
jgi:hypothetical protein